MSNASMSAGSPRPRPPPSPPPPLWAKPRGGIKRGHEKRELAGGPAAPAPPPPPPLHELERRGVGERPHPPLANQRLADPAEPPAVCGVDGDAQHGRFAVH